MTCVCLLLTDLTENKKLSCRRETARRFVSLNISLCHARSFKVIRNDTEYGVCESLLVFHCNHGCILYHFRDIQHQTSCAARWPPQYAPARADRRPISGQFVVRGQELPTAYVLPNLKIVAFSVCEILMGSQNFEIGSRTPGHAHLGANLWPGGKNCPRPMCIPNLKGVALFVCEILAHFAAVH